MEKIPDYQMNELLNLILISFIVKPMEANQDTKLSSASGNLKFQTGLLHMIKQVIQMLITSSLISIKVSF